jgi:hypothetical protein
MIKMLVTQQGCPDGIHSKLFKKDVTYTEEQTGESLAKAFVAAGMAEIVLVANKAINTAPLKQAIETAPANAGRSGLKRTTSRKG